ncbi:MULTISPECIES: MFS transporter [Burkholderia]|uniref:MFS transporter n=1 Tax=Burkholderia TaxID=32008 RepID=UPI000841287B|nr:MULTISPECIES: MFS transporter [unclassified Burkholderia]AOK29726.1 MFS transporter [Burkholderia sp. Bp7605]
MTPSTDARSLDPHHVRSMQRRAAIASLIGSVIEWYDFFIFGTAAALVFPHYFFPGEAGRSLASSFFTIFVGFVARPVGALIFGHIGDRLGRKATLLSTLLLMSIATITVGCLPGHAQWGPVAGWVLMACRFLQGIGVGGEWGGAVLLSLEWHGERRRGLIGSLTHIGVPLGLVLSVAVNKAVSLWSADAFGDTGWRYPFLFSAVLLAVGLFIRFKVDESPAFAETQAHADVPRAPIVEAMRGHWKDILLAALTRPGEQGSFYILTTFVVSYAIDHLGISRDFMLDTLFNAALVSVFTTPLFGWLSDVWGRRRVYVAGALAMAAFSFPYFMLLESRIPLAIVVAIVGSLIVHDVMYGPQAAFIAEVFPARVRYSASSIGYQFASVIAGGPAPLIAVALLGYYGSGYAVAAYLFAMSCVSAIAGALLGRRHSLERARVTGFVRPE